MYVKYQRYYNYQRFYNICFKPNIYTDYKIMSPVCVLDGKYEPRVDGRLENIKYINIIIII